MQASTLYSRWASLPEEEQASLAASLLGEAVSLVTSLLCLPSTPDPLFLSAAQFGTAMAVNSELGDWVIEVGETVLDSPRQGLLKVITSSHGSWWQLSCYTKQVNWMYKTFI